MDACLELLLPQMPQVDGLEQRTVNFVWGGVSYRQDPVTFHWGDHVDLVQTPVPAHLGNLLPVSCAKEIQVALSIRGQGLDLLQEEVNGSVVDWKGRSLEQLLRSLLSQCRQWVLVFELHCDQIDHVYRLGLDDCLVLLRQNLKQEAVTEGFVVISPTHEPSDLE